MALHSESSLSMDEIVSVVDLVFPLQGRGVPADHGYLLYAALSGCIPGLHESRWLAVHPLPGRALAGELQLPRQARLTLRLPAARIPSLLPLAGQTLRVGGAQLLVGAPSVRPISPCASLKSRMVAIRLTEPPTQTDGKLDVERMSMQVQKELERQLSLLGVTARLTLGPRRSMTVNGRRFVGWAARLDGLSERDSLIVQARGLGGKRSMGCGVFTPADQSPRQPAATARRAQS